MLKKEIAYTDLNGVASTEVAYFNLMMPEVTRLTMKYGKKGNLQDGIQDMIASDDGERMVDFIEETILKAYGRRVDSGKQFMKSKKATEEFEQSPAFAELFAELLMNPDAMRDFTSTLFSKTSAQNGPNEIKTN